MKTEIAYIYALLDPRDNEVRYIGKTVNAKYRLSQHIQESKNLKISNHRLNWIRSLLTNDIKPIIKFLKICPLSEFVKYETEYIQLYKNNKLTNSDETGHGSTGRRQEILDKQSEKMGRVVYQYDLNGNFIKEYKSVRTAALELNTFHSHISRSCNGIFKHTGGFIFRYKKDDDIKSVINPNAIKKLVIEVDKDNNEINRWESIMECARETGIDSGNISRACNKKIKYIRGRYFKFG